MAEYKPLSQTTFKFVTERTFNHVGDISAPGAPLFGKAKFIYNGEVHYGSLMPLGTTVADDANDKLAASMGGTGSSSGQIYARDEAMLNVYGDFQPDYAVLDGKKYYGEKNSQYVFVKHYSVAKQNGANYSVHVYEHIIPAGKVKVVMFSVAENTILTSEFQFNGYTLEELTRSGSSSATAYAYQYAGVKIAKTANDIILAIEFEYPKYDITISNFKDGLQYSVDDGATFQDVTTGLMFSQIEHIVFKNTGADAVNIGTTEAGTEIGTIAAGATFVAVPTADGIWYIS